MTGEHEPHFEMIASAGASRPWLTLVHGASQNSELFSEQVSAFRVRFRLFLVDLPGHGRSSAMPGPYGLSEYAAAVTSALQRAGIERTHFWGTHTGAAVGLMLAVRARQRFLSLILDGAVLPGVDVPSVTAALARARTTARTRGVAAARDEWFGQSAWFAVMRRRPKACRAAAHRAIVEAFDGAPWLDAGVPAPVAPIDGALLGLDVPVLLVNGEHDLPDFITMADTLEAQLPRVRRVVVARAGGFPLWEMPAVVNARVTEFIAACESGAI